MERPIRHKFRRDERLKNRNDFRSGMKTGSRSAGKYIVVFVMPNGLSFNRLGAGSTRRVGNAVERNRQKRLVREAYRLIKHELQTAYDIVVVPRVPWHEPSMEELQADLRDNISRAIERFETK